MTEQPRTGSQRKADTLAKLEAVHGDVWVATASKAGAAHLVPLSYAWQRDRVVLAAEGASATVRNIVDAGRAREMGLVNQVVDPVALGERVVDLAAEIASNAPLSLAGNKRMIRELRALRLPAELERELVELRESCFASDDFREGVQAFTEKRKPVWRGR